MRRNVRHDQSVFAFVTQLQDVADAVKFREQRRFLCWNKKARPQSPCAQSILQSLHQFVYAFAGARGIATLPGNLVGIRFGKLSFRQIVDLVKNDQRLFAKRIQFFNHLVYRLHLLVHARVAKVDHVNEQIGLAHFLERGLKRLDQSVRKFAQEADRVGKKNTLLVWQSETARGWIERGEKPVPR